tara:strand:+ start:467 stop:655 length:189 start_codon:yes stop_codon:yes gene_type:complete
MDKITELKIKVWEYKPLTIGLWRPIEVEEGFVKDYIRRAHLHTTTTKWKEKAYEKKRTILWM